MHMRSMAAAAFTAALGATFACNKAGGGEEERACSAAQAMQALEIRGTSLAAKQIALTFDDGPGPRTPELSTYLEARGIRAAFFVNGQMIGDASVLAKLVADGHFIANHTQTHRSLTGRSTGLGRMNDADVVSEITQTDALIAPYVTHERWLFRPPFGDYDAQTYAVVAASPMNKYVGPIGWDIGDHMGPAQAADWDCWKPESDGVVKTPAECADLYAKEIDTVGRGIVLLHDPYFIDDDPAKGGTVDLVKLLVPALEAKGYAFVRVDEVPAIAELLPPIPPSTADGGSDASIANASSADASAPASGGSSALVDPCR
ncbi:MAG: polysaccharide deacetylase family protein [Labilithrix sp.]|nr:polysaccharide deacetylase family protein [Labilithrix sp.]